jgi:hypothetical protein
MTSITKIGWNEAQAKAIYKYLSAQAHTLPMSFYRTQANRIYGGDNKASKVTAGYALEAARQAAGVGCLRMLTLFPDLKDEVDPLVLRELKATYNL